MSVPSVLYFYGLAGAGKNFVGDLVGEISGRHVYHADIDLTPEMRAALRAKENFTVPMLDVFFAVVARRILALRQDHPRGLVVTQATYRLRHRTYLKEAVPGMEMIHVSAGDDIIMERLRRRGDIVSPGYAALMRSKFEMPPPGSKTIVNEGGPREIAAQVATLYPDIATRE